MFKFLGRGLSLSILSGAIGLTFVIIVFLMAVVLVGEGPIMKGISCQFSLSEECIQQELQQERLRLQQMQQRNDELAARNEEMEALFQRLASLDHAASSYVIFMVDRSGSLVVNTGHTYASLLDPETLIGAHCYIQASTSGAGSRQIALGKMSRAKHVTNNAYSQLELLGSGISVGDIEALQARCRWPEGAS